MRWWDVGRAIRAAAVADPTLLAIYGADAIRMNAGAQDHKVPGLEWWLVSDSVTELWEPCVIQWDQWTLTYTDLVNSERALRKLFDQDLDVDIGGVYCFSVFESGADLTSPDRSGFYGRAVRFRITPIREALRLGRS